MVINTVLIGLRMFVLGYYYHYGAKRPKVVQKSCYCHFDIHKQDTWGITKWPKRQEPKIQKKPKIHNSEVSPISRGDEKAEVHEQLAQRGDEEWWGLYKQLEGRFKFFEGCPIILLSRGKVFYRKSRFKFSEGCRTILLCRAKDSNNNEGQGVEFWVINRYKNMMTQQIAFFIYAICLVSKALL